MAILEVLTTLFVIGVGLAMGMVIVGFLHMRHRLRKSMVADK